MSGLQQAKLIVILALIAAFGPITIHVMVPILPVVADEFAAGSTLTQLTLSLPLIAMACATLCFGAAADRYGRKPTLLCGLALYVTGSAMCLLAPTVEILILGRVVQAVGGASGVVISRAIIRDMFSRERTASIIGYVMSVVVLAPIFAPVLGGFLSEVYGWHSVFTVTVALGLLVTVTVLTVLRESHTPIIGVNLLGQMISAFPSLLRTPAFMAYGVYAGCGMGTFMVIAGGVSFMMQDHFGRSPADFGLYFMTLTSSFMAGTIVTARLTQRLGLDRMIRFATCGVAVTGAAIPVLFLAGWDSPWAIFAPGVPLGFCHGLAMPNAQAGGVSVNPRVAGSASGLMMFLQLIIAATMTQIAGMLGHDSPYPVAIMIAVVAFMCFASYNGLMRLDRSRKPPKQVRESRDER